MAVRTALDALTMRPTRFLRSSWPWRSALYLATGALLGCTGILAALQLFAGELTLLEFAFGVAAYTPVIACAVLVARLERRRLRLVDRYPVDDPHEPLDRPGW